METTKQERKLQDRLNRIENLLPGMKRLWELERIADELAAEADFVAEMDRYYDQTSSDKLRADALALNRLAWDLMEMRKAVRPAARHGGRYDPDMWPRERP